MPSREENVAKLLESRKIDSENFTKDKDLTNNPDYSNQGSDMLKLKGWKFIGWAHADDVYQKDLCPFVVMFEKTDTDLQLWNHVPVLIMESLARKIGAR